MPSEKIEFQSASGDLLAARLDRPDAGPARAYALFAHCFTCSKDIFAASRIAAGLAEQGIAVLRFDFTGLGHSEGEFANTNFSSNVDDLLQAAQFLRENHQAPAILIGHSLGGAAVLAVAGRVPEARAVATIGAPSEPSHVQHLFQAARPEIEAKGEAEVLLGGRSFRIKKSFLEDIESQRLESAICGMKKALMVFHSARDSTVGIENAAKIFGAAKHPKSFVSLDDADHLLSRKADAFYVADVLAAWLRRYLDDEAPTKAVSTPSGEVLVQEKGSGKFTQDVLAGRHRLIADEPRDFGGNDEGPGPYDYLLAGLGACTSMTLRLYAERKSWPLERVSVTLSHDKIHAEDCAHCESKVGRIDRMTRRIKLDGPLDEAQRLKLLEIADKCPVHRTLENEVLVESLLE
jgi:uncharacterized OsmC-like protein/alpha/beta superfamily hydrolase